MRYVLIILFIAFCGFQQNIIKNDSLHKATEVSITKSDSVQNVFITNEKSLLEKYQGLIGAFIGSLFAALIAIYSIYKTRKNQIFIENEKIKRNRYQSEKIYCGFLFSIHSILLNHQQAFEILTKELQAILETVKTIGKFTYDKPYTYLPVDLLKDNLNNVLSYENYNSKNVALLTTYLNLVENLYNDLNFIPLVKLKTETKEDEYKERVVYYFDKLFGRINTLKDLVARLLKDITDELEKSETSNVFH